MRAFLIELVEFRRKHPASDLMSCMFEFESEGNKLCETELLDSCRFQLRSERH